MQIGLNLSNYDTDAEGNAKKTNFYFTYEFHSTLKSFSFFLLVKTILKLNKEHSLKFEI